MNKPLVESTIPLYLIHLSHGVLKGETRLQKLVFVAQDKLEGQIDYLFEKAWYGPYSHKLSEIVENSAKLGFLRAKQGKTRAGYSVTEYSLTPEGKALLKYAIDSRILPQRVRRKLEEIYSSYGNLALLELLKRVYSEYPAWVSKSVLAKTAQRI